MTVLESFRALYAALSTPCPPHAYKSVLVPRVGRSGTACLVPVWFCPKCGQKIEAT